MSQDKSKNQEAGGRFSYDGLDRVIHERARLSILTSLASHGRGLLFNDLKELCSLTDGNLSRHLQILNEAGFVELWKSTNAGRQQSLYRLSPAGRQRYVDYIAILEGVVSDAVAARKVTPSSSAMLPERWAPA